MEFPMKIEAQEVKCPRCGRPAVLYQTGSASGRGHYQCSDRDNCGTQWREKNQAAVALGRQGGVARAMALTSERRSEIALNAGMINKKKNFEAKR